MRALVTGGAGFIGSHLVDTLVQMGEEVVVLDSLVQGNPDNWAYPRYVELIRGDIRDLNTVYRAMRDVDVVYHQAAIPSVPRSVADPVSCHDVNLTGTFNIFLAARDSGVRRVVYASSSSVYGDTVELPKRESMMPCPLSPYAAAKLAGEHYARLFTELYGLETVGLRYFNVFGPRQNPNAEYAAAIPRFVSLILSGESPVIYGDGEQTRDFTPVQNVVQANLAAGRAPAASGNVYNVGCGERISLNQLISVINRLAGRDVRPQYVPAKPGDVRDSLADISAARRDLGFEPRMRLEEGLACVLDSMRALCAA